MPQMRQSRAITSLEGSPARLPAPEIDRIDLLPSGMRYAHSDPRRSPVWRRPRRNPDKVDLRSARADGPARKPTHRHRLLQRRAAIDHAAAAPPSSVMNSRRRMSNMGAPSQVPPPIIPARDPPGAGGLTHQEPAPSRINLVTFCVGASLFFSGKICEKPLPFERQSLRVWHQP